MSLNQSRMGLCALLMAVLFTTAAVSIDYSAVSKRVKPNSNRPDPWPSDRMESSLSVIPWEPQFSLWPQKTRPPVLLAGSTSQESTKKWPLYWEPRPIKSSLMM